jgi:Domain of unknown function (DUF4439)
MSGAAPGLVTRQALQSVLAAEQAAVYGYGVLGAYLSGTSQAFATADWLAHQEARDALEAMLRSRGAQPVPAAVAYELPVTVRTGNDAVSLAVMIEDRVTTAYLGLVVVPAPDVREFGAQQVQASAVRGAAWRGSTVAFPGLTATVLSPSGRR